MKITINGIFPSKKNSKRIVSWGGKPKIISSEKYLSWEEAALYEVRNQVKGVGYEKTDGVIIDFYYPNQRRVDITNSAEGVMDLLVKAGVIADDNWKVVPRLILSGQIDKENPRCEIEII